MDLETALVTYLMVFTSVAGIGLMAWLLLTVAGMATSYAAAAGTGGLSLTIALKKGK